MSHKPAKREERDGVVTLTVYPERITRVVDGQEVDVTSNPTDAERKKVAEVLPAARGMINRFKLSELSLNLGFLKIVFKRGA